MTGARRVRLVILFAVCLPVLAVVVYVQLHRPSPKQPVGSGAAGPAVPREPWAKPWTTRPVLLVGLGDSVTAGFGAPPPQSYFNRLVSNPDDEFPEMKGICLSAVFPNLKALNLAVSGTISQEHVAEQLPKLEKADPGTLGIVVMTSGGNDLIHSYGRNPPTDGAMFGARLEQARPWIESYETRLGECFKRILGCFPGGCHLFVADIYDPTDGVGDIEHAGLPAWPDGEAILDEVNAAIRRAASRFPQVHVVPVHDAFLGHGIRCSQRWARHYRAEDPHYWYYDNLEDPNSRGYDAIRRLFLLEVAKVLSGSR
ncbi:MAG: SGNH/GDSL hydrolase family protein [Planctomycetes bacterium]|nr:SGNH/GDSL hydrolase family protein [Planctomycetota bacterium]